MVKHRNCSGFSVRLISLAGTLFKTVLFAGGGSDNLPSFIGFIIVPVVAESRSVNAVSFSPVGIILIAPNALIGCVTAFGAGLFFGYCFLSVAVGNNRNCFTRGLRAARAFEIDDTGEPAGCLSARNLFHVVAELLGYIIGFCCRAL